MNHLSSGGNMYIIVVYDIAVGRVSKACNFLRRYLNWVQNSVFEGDITEKQFAGITHGLKNIIDSKSDSVRFYTFRTQDQVKIIKLGQEKADTCTII